MSLAKTNKLTDRDLQIPVLVEEYHFLSTSQIQKLLFPSLQKAQTRLLRVFNNGLVKRFQYPVLLKEGGKGEYIYNIDRKLKLSFSGLLHTIQLNNIRIAFEVACRKSEGINLVDFIPEYKGEINSKREIRRIVEDSVKVSNGDKSIKFIPDGVVCLENSTNNKKILLFVELDLGSERLMSKNTENYSVLKKILLYKEYIIQKGFERYNDWFDYKFKGFRVLVVMDSKQRIKRLRTELTLRGILKFVWFSEKSVITPQTIFKNIWLTTDVSDENKHSILGSSNSNHESKKRDASHLVGALPFGQR